MKGVRWRGRQNKDGTITSRNQTGMGFGDYLRAAEDREGLIGRVGNITMKA